MSSSDDSDHTAEIELAAAEAVSTIIPAKSKALYELAYKKFNEWLQSKKTKSVGEKVLLAFYNEKSKTLKASTLWTLFSMLKCMINPRCNENIGEFGCIPETTKRESRG